MKKEELEKLIDDQVQKAVGKELDEVKEESKSRINEAMEKQKEVAKEKAKGKGADAARFLRAIAAGKGDTRKAADYAKKNWNDERFSKQLLESEYDAGGVLVPDEYAAELIDLLRAQSVVRNMGAMTMPMNSGSLTIPKLTGGTTANYIGENEKGGASEPSFGSIQMSAKKLKAIVPISNDLIRDSSPQADNVVRNDVVQQMALREDIAFIRDDGTENTPKGMYYWSNNKFNAGDIDSDELDTVTNDLTNAIFKLANANVPMSQPGWIMSPRSKFYLMQLRDGNGNYAYREDLQDGILMGYPVATTTQIPDNLGGSNDESEIYFADFAQLIIAENTNLIINVSEEASYYDGSQQVSAFDNDLTVMRALARHDFGVRHDDAVAVIEQVDWKF